MHWDFSPEVSEVERLAHQPVVDYNLDAELHAAVPTVPKLVKLPSAVGRAELLDLLPPEWAERYSREESVVAGGIREEAAEHLRTLHFWEEELRDDAGYEAMIKRMWDCGMLQVVDSVKSTVGLFTC